MTAERWQKAKQIFNQALDQPAGGQAAFLSNACGDDPELLSEVASLLAAYEEADQFIETPVVPDVLKLVKGNQREPTGRRIGQYSIMRKLGDGGMGAVYLASRADEQYEKQVAIKLVKLGFDNEFMISRFLGERQILATLDHPHIARLLDGGTTEDGSPYLVMEYIEGEPINKYCETHELSIAERLKLFRAVCAAVQYAHANLVIHRDIKPSNILVTNDGTPKLLDFGIAKLLSADYIDPGHDKTATGLLLMTPDYASPEQIRGYRVTTASDVYSLGIVLYELLTGQRPRQLNLLPASDARRPDPNWQPERPSRLKLEAPAITSRPDDQPKREKDPSPAVGGPDLTLLRGDLDNIVLMALRNEPERRYESVAQFSADIQRHLDGLPVIARKDTFKYRAGKFVQRNRVGVAAAAIILVLLIGGVIATGWQARVAAREARTARQEKARAESINAFLEKLLTYSNPSAADTKGHPTTMEEAVDEAAKRIESGEFANQPEVRAELERIIGISYNYQGRNDLAIKYLEAYVATQRGFNSEDLPKTLDASATWAMLLSFKGDLGGAEQIYRRVLPSMREEHQKGKLKPEVLAGALNAFGYLRRTQGDSREAESLFRETIALTPQVPRESRYLVRLTRSTLASTLADQGKFDEALQTAREAVEEFRQNGQTDVPDFGFSLTVLGGFLSEQGDYVEADKTLKDGEAILHKFLRPTHLWLGDNLRNQAMSFYYQNRFAEALAKADETLKIYTESFGPHYDNYPTALIIKGLIQSKTGKAKEGETVLREALRLRTESLPREHFWISLAQSALGECLTIQKRYEEAEKLLRESYDGLSRSQGAQNPRTLLAQRRLNELYQQWHKPELAAQGR